MPSPADLDHSLACHFAPLSDPRNAIQSRHILFEMIVIAIAAILSGADGWAAVAEFGCCKETWLRQFLKLPHGIPSHDTLVGCFR